MEIKIIEAKEKEISNKEPDKDTEQLIEEGNVRKPYQ